MFSQSLSVFFFVVVSCHTKDLPSYIKPCSLSAPNVKECLKNSIDDAIPTIIKGDKTYKVASLSPYTIPLIEIALGDDLKIVFKEVTAYTLIGAKVQDVSYDRAKQFLSVTFGNNILDGVTDYKMDMKLFGLVVKGEGPANLTFTDAETTLTAQLKTIKKNGVEHFAVESTTATFAPNAAHFYFGNLFNGDERLGTVTNQLLNDNWKEFLGVLEPTITKVFSGIMMNTLNGYFGLVPKDKVFLP